MKREELMQVYAFCSSIWSSFKIPTSNLELQLFNETWFIFLAPYEKSIIFTAITEYARENNFCNIAQIAELCKKYVQMQNGTYIDEEEVLQEIRSAVSYDKCAENFEKLSPFAKEIVGHKAYLAKWALSGQFETVIASNLRKTIHNTLQSKKFEDTLKGIKQIENQSFKKLEE